MVNGLSMFAGDQEHGIKILVYSESKSTATESHVQYYRKIFFKVPLELRKAVV